jgi:hypothetical protein
MTDISFLPASQLLHSFSSGRASPLNLKCATQLGSAYSWTNRQKIGTSEQVSSTAKELYCTEHYRPAKGSNYGKA